LENYQIITMDEDRKGDIWIGTDNGLFKVTTTGAELYTVKDGLSDNYITSITEDSDRNLWVGTLKGLNRIKRNPDGTIGKGIFKQEKGTFIPFTGSDRLADKSEGRCRQWHPSYQQS
jgi:ligand-binding sensor domain-containing protein